jgi:hypothetical protein
MFSRFDSIVRTSPALIKKLKYSVIVTKNRKAVKTIDDLPDASIQVQKVFGIDDSSYEDAREKLFKYSSTVKNLTIVEAELFEEFWPNFLNHFEQITHLSLVKVDFQFKTVVQLPHVEYLELIDSHISDKHFCKIFENSKVGNSVTIEKKKITKIFYHLFR